jgi:signal transduction histidine kinase
MYLLKSRYAAVMSERNRIAREWHDTLLAGFAAISWQLDVTLQRLQTGTSGAVERVELARTMIHHYRAEARRVIWDLRHEHPELESLPAAITRALEQIAQGTGVQNSCHGAWDCGGSAWRARPESASHLPGGCDERNPSRGSERDPRLHRVYER